MHFQYARTMPQWRTGLEKNTPGSKLSFPTRAKASSIEFRYPGAGNRQPEAGQ